MSSSGKAVSKARANESKAERKARKAAKAAKRAKIAAAAEALLTGSSTKPQKRKAGADVDGSDSDSSGGSSGNDKKGKKKDKKKLKKKDKKSRKKSKKSKPLEIVPASKKPKNLVPGALASRSAASSSSSSDDDDESTMGGSAPADTTGMGAGPAPGLGGGRARSNSATTRMRTRSMDKAEKVAANENISAEDFRKKHTMEVEGLDEERKLPYSTPQPILLFKQAPFSSVLKKVFDAAGFATPTPIQSQAWPICVEGRDMISVARTGSGKTLGFLLPTFLQIDRLSKLGGGDSGAAMTEREKVWGRPRGPGGGGRVTEPLAVVLAPTRELAMQINVEAGKFGKPQGINSVCIYGGESKWLQVSAMNRTRPQLIIATPGRLNDMCSARKISLKKVGILVLDEADRMLDMGFEPQLDEIRGHMPDQLKGSDRPLPSSGKCGPTARQTLLFTATWPKSVERIAAKLLHNPVKLNVGKSGVLVANEKIAQEVIVLAEHDKQSRLMEILSKLPADNKTLVFLMRKRDCDSTANKLWEQGYNCDAIHGDKEQRDRTRIMAAFKSGSVPLLFATDVAARGLDVSDVTHVINYDFPNTKGKAGIEEFVHRIGRTGRAGKKGIAITFFTRDNRNNAFQLCQLLKRANQPVPPELEAMGGRGGRQGGGGGWNRNRFGGRGGGRGGRGGRGGGRGGRGRRW
eukprot:INCI3263.3.p1 GENE.INCI3263.3~~INCI3263.3.p1  ORF type:complete len:690 (-),score=170.29 INCI3263.3:143-2212(-)